jgi:hypothetical protein
MTTKCPLFTILLLLFIVAIFIIACSDPSDSSEQVQDENNPPVTDDPLPPVNDPDAKEITFSLTGGLTVTDKLTGPVIVSCVSNNLFFTGCQTSEDILRIYDITDPLNPHFMGEVDIDTDGGSFTDIFVKDNIVFCAMGYAGIAIVDANNPFNPELLSVNNYIEVFSLYVQGNYLYCGRPSGHFYIFDISDPANPERISKIESDSSVLANYLDVMDIYVSGDYAYITGGDYLGGTGEMMYLAVVGIKDPYNPVVKKRYTGDQWRLNGNTRIKKLVIRNNYAYLATGDGLVIFDVSDPLNITDVGFYGTPWWLYNIVIDGNYAYCSMYDQDNESFSFLIINIEDPSLPVEVSTTSAGTYSSLVPLSIYKTGAEIFAFCFIREGMKVLNVSAPAVPLEAGFVPYYDSFVWALNQKILVNGDYAYMTKEDDANSLVIFDVSNPAAPFITGKLSAESTGFHDFDAMDILLYDNYAYLKINREDNYNSEGLAIVNIADRNNPVFAGFVPDIFYVKCFTVFENTMYISDRLDNLILLDLTNPENPVKTAQFQLPNYECSAIFVNRQSTSIIAYIAYHIDSSLYGLRIYDITDPDNPVISGELAVPHMRAYKLFVKDSTLFIMSNYYYYKNYPGLFIINVTARENPVLSGVFDFPANSYLTDMLITGDFAVLSIQEKGICALDISNPARPLYSGNFNHRNDNMCMSIDIKQNHIFVANGTSDESLFVLEYK